MVELSDIVEAYALVKLIELISSGGRQHSEECNQCDACAEVMRAGGCRVNIIPCGRTCTCSDVAFIAASMTQFNPTFINGILEATGYVMGGGSA